MCYNFMKYGNHKCGTFFVFIKKYTWNNFEYLKHFDIIIVILKELFELWRKKLVKILVIY